MSVTKEKNLEAMKSLILENKDFGVKEIVNILNNLGFRKDNGLPWQYSSLYSFICTHLKDFKHDIKTRIIKDLNELELDITNTSIIKDSKEIYQENLLAINKVILNNQDKTLSEIAGILNTFGYKTKRGVDWDLNKVNYHMIAILQLTPRKEAGTAIKESYENYDSIFKIISECRNLTYPRIAKILNEYNLKTKRGNSWNDQSVRKFLRDELKINKSPDMLRFQENIMNQLEKVEPKVIPQPEPEIETEIEVIPKYEITELVVKNNNGKFVTDSLKIASIFKRDHKNVLRDIKELNCSEKFSLLNFEQSEYLNDRGRKYPLFILSKDGFTKLVFGWKDDKSSEFQELYIEQFNKMEEALKNHQSKEQIKPPTYSEALRLLADNLEKTQLLEAENKKQSDEIKELIPQSLLLNVFTATSELKTLRQIGYKLKQYDLGPNKIFKFLRKHGVLVISNGENYPTHAYRNLIKIETVVKRWVDKNTGEEKSKAFDILKAHTGFYKILAGLLVNDKILTINQFNMIDFNNVPKDEQIYDFVEKVG